MSHEPVYIRQLGPNRRFSIGESSQVDHENPNQIFNNILALIKIRLYFFGPFLVECCSIGFESSWIFCTKLSKISWRKHSLTFRLNYGLNFDTRCSESVRHNYRIWSFLVVLGFLSLGGCVIARLLNQPNISK